MQNIVHKHNKIELEKIKMEGKKAKFMILNLMNKNRHTIKKPKKEYR